MGDASNSIAILHKTFITLTAVAVLGLGPIAAQQSNITPIGKAQPTAFVGEQNLFIPSGDLQNGTLNLNAISFEEDFESFQSDLLPASWTSSLDPNGGFYIGDATDANQGGFWNVPTRSKFAMSNDDVCDCNSSQDYLILPDQDFTGLANMALCFEAFDNGDGNLPSQVQIDTGMGWSTLFTIPTSTNWQSLFIPLTGTDGLSSVKLRFHFNDGGNHAAGLAIDDIVIAPLNVFDLELTEVFYNGTADSTSAAFYSQIPYRQALNTAIQFGAEGRNVGSANLTNTYLQVNVTGPVGFSNTFGSLSIAPFTDGLIDLPGAGFTAASLGTYTADFLMESAAGDASLTNNSRTESFEVTERVYARDNGNYTGSGVWGGSPNGFLIGNRFEIKTTDTLTAAQAFFHSGTQSGSVVRFHLFNANFDMPAIVSGEVDTLDLNQIGQWATFPLPETPLPPGLYTLAFEAIGGTVFAAVDPLAPQAAPLTSFINPSGPAPWTYTEFVPFVRMQLKPFNNPCPAVLNETIAAISCFGDTDGKINLAIVGATQAPTYAWSTGSSTDSIENLAGGTYTVTVTYGTCQTIETYVLQEPSLLNITPSAIDVVCGDDAGRAIPLIAGGTPPFAGIWSDGQNTVVASDLAIGTYAVTITDANGCQDTESIPVGGTPAADFNMISTEPSCGGSDGSIGLVPSSGFAPYTYVWQHDGTLTDSSATNLTVGIYRITMTDSNGCSSMQTNFLNNQNAPVSLVDSTVDATCHGSATGGIYTSESGGTAPYTYLWSDPNGSTAQDLVSTTAGIYFLTITDNAGCINFLTDTIQQPDTLLADIELLAGLTCVGDSTGQLRVVASGGVPDYTYIWSNDSINDTIVDLWVGQYAVTVTDANNCQALIGSAVPDADPIVIDLIAITHDDTLQGGQGAILIEVSGGTSPYNYLWSNNLPFKNIDNLKGGPYSITVTDANGCMDSATYFVDFPTGIGTTAAAETKLTTYPNPTSDLVWVKLETAKTTEQLTQITLTSSIGQVLLNRQLPTTVLIDQDYSIDLSDLSQGIYFLSINIGQERIYRRIVRD